MGFYVDIEELQIEKNYEVIHGTIMRTQRHYKKLIRAFTKSLLIVEEFP